MNGQKQVKRGRKIVGPVRPAAGARAWNALGAREWRKELFVSWLFRTCIKLQTSFDRRFLRFGMTVQEASVLLRCVQAGGFLWIFLQTNSPGTECIGLKECGGGR